MKRPDAAIMPVDKDGYMTLVCRNRAVIGRMTWETPAGKLNFAEEDSFHMRRPGIGMDKKVVSYK